MITVKGERIVVPDMPAFFVGRIVKVGWGDLLAMLIRRLCPSWLVPKGCRACEKRQEKLNRFGRLAAKWRKRVAPAAASLDATTQRDPQVIPRSDA